MNFFGHATVACWKNTRPSFVLGAMLPDFERMSGARPGDLDEVDLLDGVRWHHRTDAAFHACPTFLELCREARSALRDRGLPRGACMAVAHVGIELLLDGLLLGDDTVEHAYAQALQVAHGPGGPLRWRSRTDEVRFERLRARLVDAGPPTGYRDCATVAERLHHITTTRPRLAFDIRLVAGVRDWADATRSDLDDRLEALLAELEARI
jgi:acyl carrier protein phosphodiesterase